LNECRVPPNVSFEIDDIEKEWTWTKPFDFIHSRDMAGSFGDYQEYIDKIFNALEPGGYLEMQDFDLPYRSDDNTLTPDMALLKMPLFFIEASEKLGRCIDVTPKYKAMMEKAGFEDVKQQMFKWPLNGWPRDPFYKELGQWTLANIDTGLEGLCLALYTRGLKWTAEETLLFCSEVRKQLRDQKIHGYVPVYVTYGRKPVAGTAASTTAQTAGTAAPTAAQTAPTAETA